MKKLLLPLLLIGIISCENQSKKESKETSNQGAFPYIITDSTKNRKLSAAMDRSFNHYSAIHPRNNELYSQFKYTELKGFNYNNHDGTISRRDPSKVIFENGKYYVWYTKRDTPVIPVGARNADKSNDTIPSTDWDLAEIWYATSENGFTWKEQSVAVPRPPKPEVGWRSVTTTDILKWKGKYYLYYQGFMEASGKRGDYCPVTASYADSPDGPWTPVGKIVIENGPEGSWDQYAIHDPYPLVHDGKIYIYYKSAFNRPNPVWVGGGLVIGDDPLGPFKKHPLNPLTSSGHEVSLFPFKEGVAAITVKDGTEHFTIQYAKDWVNFEIASVCELVPIAPGPYVPDAFTDTKDGRGISWGLSHFVNAGKYEINPHSILTRFDCDLSQDIDDPVMKETGIRHDLEVYYKQGLNKKQFERIEKENEKLRSKE